MNSPTWSANISPRTPEFPSSDFNELKEKGNDTRPRSPSERSGSDQSITYGEEDVSTDQEGEAGTETETAKLVAQAIATNNEDWEGTVRVIESNNSTELEELKETHADELKELRQEHQQKVQHLLRTHAVAQRTIAKKGERDIKVFQDQLKDLKKDKEAIEGKLLYLTTEVEALAAEIIGEKDRLELAANTALRIQAAQDEHKLHEADSMPVVAHTTSLPQKPVETSAPYESRTDSYSKGIFSNPKFPTAQRLLRVEAENARLRTDLAQRHEDVTFYVTQNQRLRLTMQADPVKEAYVDLQLFKLTDTVAELQERLVQYDTVLEREKRASEAESQRLLDRISVLSEEKRRSELDVQYHKEAKEEPWNQNSSLLSNLKDNFTKTNFDKAFLKHHELLLKEMKELEYKVNAYEFERKERIEEVNVLRQKIRALELDDCALKSKAKIHELEDRIKRMAIERDDRDSELGFFHSKAQAEKEAEENAKRDPNVELAVQELVLCARDDEIARLKIKLEAYNPVGNEQVEPTSFDDGFPGCIEESPRPEGSFGFF